jgi:hypothetical protein
MAPKLKYTWIVMIEQGVGHVKGGAALVVALGNWLT